MGNTVVILYVHINMTVLHVCPKHNQLQYLLHVIANYMAESYME